MDSKIKIFDETVSNGVGSITSSVHSIAKESDSFGKDNAKTSVKVENVEPKSNLAEAAKDNPVMDDNSARKYDKRPTELSKEGFAIDSAVRDTQEFRGMDLVVDVKRADVLSSPESHIQHRENPTTLDIRDLCDAGKGDTDLNNENFFLHTPQFQNKLRDPPCTVGNSLYPPSKDQVDDNILQHNVSNGKDSEGQVGLVVGSQKSSFNTKAKAPYPLHQSLSSPVRSESLKVDLPIMRYLTSPSVPVTLLGVSTDLRRKRIKKVSNYIIGALLGEGTYGVVRDGLDISGERIVRCAVKMSNISTGSKAAAKDRPALKRTDRAAYLRLINQREAINLQRFHSPYIVHASDVFAMNGKEYIILPIAICNLEQLVQDALHETLVKQQHLRARRGNFDFKELGTEFGLQGGTATSITTRTPTTTPAEVVRDGIPRNAAGGDGAVEQDDRAALKEETASTASYRSGIVQGYRGPLRGHHHGGDSPDHVNDPSNNERLTPMSTLEEDSRSVSFSVTSCSSLSSTSTTVCANLQTEISGKAGQNSPPHLLKTPNDSFRAPPQQQSCRDERGPEPFLSTTLIRGIMFQIFSGVNYLHLQNSAHNDIKASNILLFEDGSVKLTDLGSVGERYEGYGTPLYAAPELCKYFYGLLEENDDTNGKSSGMDEARSDGEGSSAKSGNRDPRRGGLLEIDAKKCDMWCCGLILYKLLTGKDGPLQVHQNYRNRQHRDISSDYDDSSVTPASLINCFQLYREIALQKEAVCLDDVPDLTVGTPELGQSLTNSFQSKYPSNSVRSLLEKLLAINPEERFTAKEALAHPWIKSLLELNQAFCGQEQLQSPHDSSRRKDSVRRYMEEAIRCSIARKVLQSPHVRKILKKDNENHLQFVSDCCNILNVDIPEEVFKPFGTEPYENNYYSGLWERVTPPLPQLVPAAHRTADAESGTDGVVMGTLVRPNMPRVMPRGCVDPHLFLPFDEANYYERKSGKKGFDVRCLLGQPAKVRQLEAYLHNVVLVKCGYRVAPDPAFEPTACGGHGLLPGLRYHLGSLGGEVGCLYSPPPQRLVPTTVFQSRDPPPSLRRPPREGGGRGRAGPRTKRGGGAAPRGRPPVGHTKGRRGSAPRPPRRAPSASVGWGRGPG